MTTPLPAGLLSGLTIGPHRSAYFAGMLAGSLAALGLARLPSGHRFVFAGLYDAGSPKLRMGGLNA